MSSRACPITPQSASMSSCPGIGSRGFSTKPPKRHVRHYPWPSPDAYGGSEGDGGVPGICPDADERQLACSRALHVDRGSCRTVYRPEVGAWRSRNRFPASFGARNSPFGVAADTDPRPHFALRQLGENKPEGRDSSGKAVSSKVEGYRASSPLNKTLRSVV